MADPVQTQSTQSTSTQTQTQTQQQTQVDGSILGGNNPTITDPLLGTVTQPPTQPAEQTSVGGGQVNQSTAVETAAPPVVGLVPLPENASDDQKRDFYNKLRALNSVPDSPEAYGDFGLGDKLKVDTTGDDYKYYSKVFHDVGMSKAQVAKLLEAHKKYTDVQLDFIKKQTDAGVQEYRQQMKSGLVKELGGEQQYDAFRETAVRGFKATAKGSKLTDKEITGLLNIMGDDPRFVKIFNHIGANFREDVLITGSSPGVPEKTMDMIIEGLFEAPKGG